MLTLLTSSLRPEPSRGAPAITILFSRDRIFATASLHRTSLAQLGQLRQTSMTSMPQEYKDKKQSKLAMVSPEVGWHARGHTTQRASLPPFNKGSIQTTCRILRDLELVFYEFAFSHGNPIVAGHCLRQ
ncbi:hypothetical protein J1614_011680 [Plenodomus biglobosus]|nr:hypothetical protein J1614_011680 [Plenodomus biglobosus]